MGSEQTLFKNLNYSKYNSIEYAELDKKIENLSNSLS